MSNVSGISVSVESSPRTPVSSSGNHVSGGPGAPMKKRYEVSAVEVIEVIDVSSDEEEEESVSPRVLFPVGGPSRGGMLRVVWTFTRRENGRQYRSRRSRGKKKKNRWVIVTSVMIHFPRVQITSLRSAVICFA